MIPTQRPSVLYSPEDDFSFTLFKDFRYHGTKEAIILSSFCIACARNRIRGVDDASTCLSVHDVEKISMGLYCVKRSTDGFYALVHYGLLEKINYSGGQAAALLQQKTPSLYRFPMAARRCEWCKTQTLLLDKHHYPIPKSKGGTEVVNICATCHREFHSLLLTKRYRPTEQSLEVFRKLYPIIPRETLCATLFDDDLFTPDPGATEWWWEREGVRGGAR